MDVPDKTYMKESLAKPAPFDHFPEEPSDDKELYAVLDGCETPFRVTNVKFERKAVKNDAAETVDGRYRYDLGGIKAEDVIARVMARVFEACGLMCTAWDVGNALKYLLRLGKKDDTEIELGKAENYLHHARTGEWLK